MRQTRKLVRAVFASIGSLMISLPKLSGSREFGACCK